MALRCSEWATLAAASAGALAVYLTALHIHLSVRLAALRRRLDRDSPAGIAALAGELRAGYQQIARARDAIEGLHRDTAGPR